VAAIRSARAIAEQKATERASEKEVAAQKKAILAALQDLRSQVSLGEIERLIADGAAGVEVLAKASPLALRVETIRAASGRLLFNGIASGRSTAARQVPASVAREAAAAARRAGATERAATWASKRSAELVTAVTDSVRASIRLVVADGVARGAHTSTIAREVRDVIGLDERRAAALQNFRAMQAEQGVAAAEIEKRASAYAERLLSERAELISRTETFRAVNEGRSDLWRELDQEGVVPAASVSRTWITSRDERVDDICEDLDGETVGLNEDFSDGSYAPPDPHPGCRCSILFEVA